MTERIAYLEAPVVMKVESFGSKGLKTGAQHMASCNVLKVAVCCSVYLIWSTSWENSQRLGNSRTVSDKSLLVLDKSQK